MKRHAQSTLLSLSLVVLLGITTAACGSPTPPPPRWSPRATFGATATLAPHTLSPSAAVPTIAAASVSIPSAPVPSFGPDAAIEQAFPREIGGSAVREIQSANFLDLLQAVSGRQVTEFVQTMQSRGIDVSAVGMGAARIDLDGQTVEIEVVRFPGTDAAIALEALVALRPPIVRPTLAIENLGGKTVTSESPSGGRSSYFYVNGEWAWLLQDATPQQAQTIFAALP